MSGASLLPGDEPRLVLVGSLIPATRTISPSHGEFEIHEGKIIPVPNGLRRLLSWLRRPRTLSQAQDWLIADGAPDDAVLRELVLRGRLRLLHADAPHDTLDELHDLVIRMLGVRPYGAGSGLARSLAASAVATSAALDAVLDASAGGEDLPATVSRLGLDAADVLWPMADLLAADLVRLEPVYRRIRG